MRSYTMPTPTPSPSRTTAVSHSADPNGSKPHYEKRQHGQNKRRQSFATETTNYVNSSGPWAPVLSSEPVSSFIPTSPSVTAGRTLRDKNSPPYKVIQAEHPTRETKSVRFEDSDTVQEPDLEEDLEWSDCMQRRLEQQAWYPYHHGYTQQGGPTLLPSPIHIPVQGQYASHPMYLRTSPIPLWVPGYHPVGLHSVVLNPHARY